MKQIVESALRKAAESVAARLGFVVPETIEIDIPKKKEFGDYTSNLAMIAARGSSIPPRELAERLIDALPEGSGELFTGVEIKGPGFINFFVNPSVIAARLTEIQAAAGDYGKSSFGDGKRVQVEYVSANPTGYLHIGHARNAAVGSAIVSLLRATGHEVEAEYYINDAGNQIEMLGRSVLARLRELRGEEFEVPEDGYHGEYIKEIARELLDMNESDVPLEEKCREFAISMLMREIKADLEGFRAPFDSWYSERENLQGMTAGVDGPLGAVLATLAHEDATYTKEGATWFRATGYGDSQDWVLVKSDGSSTYFLTDIAYHSQKFSRGFSRIIDVWGADHHSHVARLASAVKAMGLDPGTMETLLIQFVRLVSGGEEIKMSKRSGSFVTMREVVREVGVDVARFFLLMRNTDSHLDFDIDLAKRESSENPVYYIQYANARIKSVFAKAEGRGLKPVGTNLGLLVDEHETDLIKKLLLWPEVVEESAKLLAPHKIVFYLQELASIFHIYYNSCRILDEDISLSQARLYFIDCIRLVLKNGLTLLGISVPDRM